MKEKQRCDWPGDDPLYVAYHDEEWGVPIYDSQQLFEKLILDGFQAGLSWITILRKRQTFLMAFDNFDPVKISRYDDRDIERLMNDPGIIRNRLKILATISNARIYLAMEKQKSGAFSDFIWSFTNGEIIQNNWQEMGQLPAATPQSEAMSKALKAKGFKFCGPTICYAFMQAVGMVNDHFATCFRHGELK
ncbi:DNA-3-methyladenine glycosylase [hydrothermal vent metagenome]|uniref:DNA-3-methyladenine glycosylase n=1 Tax=hydrothermal vent metagenome TaxID=652676 RepID=A0A3B0RB18_9ZZZZ